MMTARMQILPDGSQALTQEAPLLQMQETSMFLQCQSQGLDSNHGPILATYSNVRATECALKCNKFFFKESGEENCMCTATGRLRTTRVILNSSTVVGRLAYFLSCGGSDQDYGFYDVAAASSQSPNRRLLQAIKAKSLASSLLQRPDTRLATAFRPTPKSLTGGIAALRPGLAASLIGSAAQRTTPDFFPGLFAPKEPAATDLCFDQQTSDKESAPASCSPDSPKFVLPKAWLDMNNLSADFADPCAKYKPPVGTRGIQCVNL
jgi:hypothetical protein